MDEAWGSNLYNEYHNNSLSAQHFAIHRYSFEQSANETLSCTGSTLLPPLRIVQKISSNDNSLMFVTGNILSATFNASRQMTTEQYSIFNFIKFGKLP